MFNLNDYLKWRGDLNFDQDEFNDIDSLILARFSYFPFNKIKMDDEECIGSVSQKMKKLEESDFGWPDDKELSLLLGKSERFKNLKVLDFVNNDDREAQRQFSAIAVQLKNEEFYISYCGTNATLYGWKEDFNMSFQKNVPAQKYGLEYLENFSNKHTGKLRLGGHSKGGNIAVYASTLCNSSIQDRILRVTNYDGPGLDKTLIDTDGYKNVIKKIVTYVPQGSVIGRVLEHEEKIEIVKSNAKGLYQHDVYSWEVMGKELVRVKTNSDSSNLINATVRNWLKETTPEQRKIFVDSVYEVIEASEAEYTKDLSSSIMKNLNKVSKAYRELSKDDKNIIGNNINEAVKSFRLVLSEMAKEKASEGKAKGNEFLEKIKNKIKKD